MGANPMFFGLDATSNIGSALLAWLMNEGSGGTLNDSSGRGEVGNTNGGWSGASPPPGNTYYQTFNGSSQFAYSAYNVAYLGQHIITLDFYIASSVWSYATPIIIAFCNSATPGGFLLYINGNTGRIRAIIYDASGNSSIYDMPVPVDSSWHRFKVVLNNANGTIQIYVDGAGNIANLISSSWATPMALADGQLWLSSAYGASEFFSGKMARFKILIGDTH